MLIYSLQIQQSVDLIIIDVNDENPTFEQGRYEINVPEVRSHISSIIDYA